MPTDDDADDPLFGAPLPPDDRLWRHPSELGSEGAKQHIVLVERSTGGWARMLGIALLAGIVGAGATLGLVAVGGGLRTNETAAPPDVQRVQAEVFKVAGESDLAIADKVLPSIGSVQVTGNRGTRTGTALVFQADGHLITTADLVDGAERIAVQLYDGSRLDATLVGRSVESDLAVIKVDRAGLTPARGATSVAKTFGSHTILIDAGMPTRAPQINVGFVSAESRSIVREDSTVIFGLLQVSTRPTVGQQGPGAVVVDDGGTVMGLVTSRATTVGGTTIAGVPGSGGGERSTSSQAPTSPVRPTDAETSRDLQSDSLAMHLAIPADLVWNLAGQLVDAGQIVRPSFPVTGRDISAGKAAQLDVAGGFELDRPLEGSPAQKAGLRAGDVIVEFGDEHIGDENDLRVAIRHHRPGEQVKVAYVRNGERTTTLVTLDAKPELP